MALKLVYDCRMLVPGEPEPAPQDANLSDFGYDSNGNYRGPGNPWAGLRPLPAKRPTLVEQVLEFLRRRGL